MAKENLRHYEALASKSYASSFAARRNAARSVPAR
jgi:hypothetical protein